MNSELMYKKAYNTHYKDKKYSDALIGYLKTIEKYPDSSETQYAKQQISTMKREWNIYY